MKRNSMKTGSIVMSGSANVIPPYQPLLSLSANKQIPQQYQLQETNSVLNILQQDPLKNKSTRIQSTSTQQIIQQQPLSKVSSFNPSVSSLPQSYSSNSLLGSASKSPDHLSLLQHNQRLIMSTQKAGSLNTNNQQQQPISFYQNTQQPMPSSSSSVSKSPIHTGSRSQTQSTPTSQKNSSNFTPSANLGLSPKPQTTITNTSKTSSAASHSQRLSLATTQGNISYVNNENLSQNRRHDSKQDLQKKPSLAQPESVVNANNFLRENNNLKNIMQTNLGMNQPIQSDSSAKDIISTNLQESLSKKQLNLKNLRNTNPNNSSYNIESSQNIATTAITTNGSIRGNLLKDSNLLSQSPSSYYQNYLSSDKNNSSYISAIHTPKSPSTGNVSNSLSSKSNLHYLFNPNPSTHSQNTENDPHLSSTEQSNTILNTSGLSAITSANLAERTPFDPHSSSITSPQQFDGASEFFGQKCINHPDKKAKYIVYNSESDNNLCCSKCAVELSKCGFQTIHLADYAKQQQFKESEFQHSQSGEISSSTSPSNSKNPQNATETETQIKLKEINSFLEVVDQQSGKWQELNHALLIKKKDVSNFFERQASRIDNHFNGYIELLNQIRNSTLQKLQENKEKSVSIYQVWEKETKESLTDFINIKADIEMNTDKIVNLIQMDDFRRIIGSYQDKLAKMKQFFGTMGNECLELIKFDNQSPPPIMLAPQLQNSFNLLNFSTTLVKKRVSEFVQNKKNSNNSMQMNSYNNLLSSNSTNNSLSPNIKQSNSNRQHTGESARGSLSGSEIHSHNFMKLQSPQVNPQIGQLLGDIIPSQNHYNLHCNSPVKIELSSKSDQPKKEIYVSFGNNKEFNKAIIHQGKIPLQTNQQQQEQQQSIPQIPEPKQVYHYQSSLANESLQATPLHNNGVYIHQIRPLTDIIEHTSVYEEDDKSQPNTPELKQIEDIPSRISNTTSQIINGQQVDQQKPFRTLFGEEGNSGNNQKPQHYEQNISEIQGDPHGSSSNYQTNSSSSLGGQYLQQFSSSKQQLKSPGQNYDQQFVPSETTVQGSSQGQIHRSSGNSRSPRYSIIDQSETEGTHNCDIQYNNYHNNLSILPMASNISSNNQLEDYLSILGKQNPQEMQGIYDHPFNNCVDYSKISSISNLPQTTSNGNSCYVSANCSPNTSRISAVAGNNYVENQLNQKEPMNQQEQHQQIMEHLSQIPNEEDVVIVTHDKQEEMDNPLFSSPRCQQ